MVAKDTKPTASAAHKTSKPQQQQPVQTTAAMPAVKPVQPIQPTAAVPAMANAIPVNATVKKPLPQPAIQRNLSNVSEVKSNSGACK